MARIFTDEEKLGIYNDYANCMSIKKIAKKYHTGYKKVKTTLLEQGIDINDYSKPIGIKKHVANYWNSYENLEALAKICTSKKDFDNHSHSAWIAAKRNGWFDELAEKYFKPKVKELKPSNRYMVYAFEIPSKHSVYIGRTMNLKKRIATHKWSPYGDAFNQYCEKNNIDFPEPIILQKDMEVEEAKEARKKFISQYKADGWKIINAISKKEKTEPKGRIKWTYEACKQEAAKYGSKSELWDNNKSCYRIIYDKGWLDEFYPEKPLDDGLDTFESYRNAALKYKSLRQLKAKYPNLYKKLDENNWNDRINYAFKCKNMGIDITKNKSIRSLEQFIKKAKQIHGDKYDYSKSEYNGYSTPLTIICPKHGKFLQSPNYHLKGRGCRKCRVKEAGILRRGTTEEFIAKAKAIHGNKYDYSKVNYDGAMKNVTIICPTHGEFHQSPNSHLSGSGCPTCGISISRPENEIAEYICGLIGEDKVIRHDRLIMRNGKELDIVVPDFKLAIEFDGLVWHSEQFKEDKNYHMGKTEACEKHGYRLVHIFEDEWRDHKDIVCSKIRHMINCDEDKKCIGARKCIIKEVDTQNAKDFLGKYHIQGFGASTIYYGGYYNDELIGVMSFKRNSKDCNDWELTRFATTDSYRLPGLADKMFKQFIKDWNPDSVKSFLDRRWNRPGNTVYEKLGFKIDKIEKPDYSYVINKGHDRVHKFLFRKQRLNKKYGFPLTMTESEMADELEAYKIWNCGLVKYLWRRKDA